MALSKYTPDASKIVHSTGVDFVSRPTTFIPIRLVQYDNKMPVLAVSLYSNGESYAVPATGTANIRWGKQDHKFVQNPALGWNDDRTILYFEITPQMVTEYGKFYPVVEIIVGNEVSASSPIQVIVDKNPIQNDDIEDTTEFKTLTDYVSEAKDAATQADKSKTAAAKSASEAATSAASAKVDAGKTAQDRSTVAADKAAVQDMASQVTADKANVQSNTAKAAQSEANSKKWEELSKSYAIGESESGREEEATENSKSYFEQTRAIANSMTSALKPKGNIVFDDLIALTEKAPGDYYNVTDAFTSTADFTDGGNKHYPAGTDVFYTIDSKWNTVQGSGVSGVKGEAETIYRTGQVSISKTDIGLGFVQNTADADKRVLYAETAGTATDPTKLPLTGGKVSGTIYGTVVAASYTNKNNEASGYTKININDYGSWMLVFTLRLYYLDYVSRDIMVSGYNYDVSKNWHRPKAVTLGLTDYRDRLNQIDMPIYFGKDEDNHLWIAIQKRGYDSIDIMNVSSAWLYDIKDYANLFTFEDIDELPSEDTYVTVIAYPPLLRNQQAASAAKVANPLTIGSASYNGSTALAVSKENIVETLGYEPPVNDTQGVNLVLNSAVEVSNGNFSTQTYHLSEKIELNQTYTATIWGELDSSKTKYTVYIEDYRNSSFLSLAKVADGIYRATGKLDHWESDSKKEHADIIQILPYPYGGIKTGTNTIHRIKLEPGTVTDPVWTPAPEDLVTGVNGVHGDVEIGGTNLISNDPSNWRIGGYDFQTGVFSSGNPSRLTTVNAIQANYTNYIFNATINGKQVMAALHFFDSSDAKILSVDYKLATNFIIQPPSNASYFHISLRTSDEIVFGSPDYINNFIMKLERGNVPTDWSPCPEDVVTKSELKVETISQEDFGFTISKEEETISFFNVKKYGKLIFGLIQTRLNNGSTPFPKGRRHYTINSKYNTLIKQTYPIASLSSPGGHIDRLANVYIHDSSIDIDNLIYEDIHELIIKICYIIA